MARASFDPHYRESWNEAQMSAVLAGPGGLLLVAYDAHGRAVAFALCRHVVDEVELLLCATHPAARRRGLGRATIAAVIAEGRRRGAARLFLEVRESNAPARALYGGCGLKPVGCRKSYYRSVSGELFDAITMALTFP